MLGSVSVGTELMLVAMVAFAQRLAARVDVNVYAIDVNKLCMGSHVFALCPLKSPVNPHPTIP